MGIKYGIDEPLNYWAAMRLLDDVDPDKGRALNWGGLRMFRKTGVEVYDAIPIIKKGCVEMVRLFPQSTMLMPGHWRSNLGMKVMEVFCHYPIVCYDQMWYLTKCLKPRISVLFQDGMRVFNNGRISPEVQFDLEANPNPGASVWPIFERYIESFVAAIGRGEFRLPTAEDCWLCYFYSTREVEGARVPKCSEPGGVAHLFEHAAKAEPVPSLMWRAMQEGNLNPHNRWANVVGDKYTSSDLHTARDLLTGYFRRRLGLLGAYHFGLAARMKEKSANDRTGSQGSADRVGQQPHGDALQPRLVVPGM
jgi:hypothetical protein